MCSVSLDVRQLYELRVRLKDGTHTIVNGRTPYIPFLVLYSLIPQCSSFRQNGRERRKETETMFSMHGVTFQRSTRTRNLRKTVGAAAQQTDISDVYQFHLGKNFGRPALRGQVRARRLDLLCDQWCYTLAREPAVTLPNFCF